MIRSVELLPCAWESLLHIKHHVAEAFDQKTAEKAVSMILDALERLQSSPESGSLTPDPGLNSLGYRMLISDRGNLIVYKRIDGTIYIYLIADTEAEYARIFRDLLIHEEYTPGNDPGKINNGCGRMKAMYCEKCSRIIETDRCPVCKSRKIREPEAKDPCYLTEQDYISSGILEDVLKQNNIPYLKKDVMGAGMAIKVGPMLERSRFYVPFEQWSSAMEIMESLFSSEEAAEAAPSPAP